MKPEFYVDVFRWTTPENANAWVRATAPAKPQGARRYLVRLDVPDPAEPDEVVDIRPEEATP